MRLYWDAEWSAWIAAWPNGDETILPADSEAEALLMLEQLEEDEGILWDE